jgi:hypothetical protein
MALGKAVFYPSFPNLRRAASGTGDVETRVVTHEVDPMAAPDDDIEVGEFELTDKLRVWPRSACRVGEVSVVYAFDRDRNIPTHRRLLLMVLLLALKDRAAEVHFEPCRSENAEGRGMGVRMSFETAGELYELVPPPARIARPLFRDLNGHLPAQRDCPRRRHARRCDT